MAPVKVPLAKLVPPLSYDEVIVGLGKGVIDIIQDDSYNPISGVSIDSRNLYFGEMFLALDGENFRGFDFITVAYAQGVRVFVIPEKYSFELKSLPEDVIIRCCFFLVRDPVESYQNLAQYYLERMGGLRIAITGSAGKTTTKELLTKVLKKHFGVFCSYKNENNFIGVPKNVFSVHRRLIGGESISLMVFELGMNHSGEISRLASLIKPHIAVITNILYSHIGHFTCREDLVHAKGEVIPYLIGHQTYLDHHGGILLIPEDIFGKEILLNKISSSPPPSPICREVKTTVVTESHWEDQADTICLEKTKAQKNLKKIVSKWTDTLSQKTIKTSGLSVFLGETLSLVLEVGKIIGIPRQEGFRSLSQSLEETEEKLPHWIESRLALLDYPGKPLIIDDSYNANPDSMIQVVSSLINLFSTSPPHLQLRIVLGDMLELGGFSESLHRSCGIEIGKMVRTLSSKDQKRIQFFFLGPEMKSCYDNVNFPLKKYYDSYSPETHESHRILDDLKEVCDIDSLIFFKASRGMKLNQLLKNFLKSFIPSSKVSPTP